MNYDKMENDMEGRKEEIKERKGNEMNGWINVWGDDIYFKKVLE